MPGNASAEAVKLLRHAKLATAKPTAARSTKISKPTGRIRAAALPSGQTGNIATLAGGASLSPAAASSIGQAPSAVLAVGRHVYVADRVNSVIRDVDLDTQVESVLVGTGVAGYSGDGGPGTAAALNTPMGLAADAGGNLFIADAGNHVIRMRSSATGVVSTVAGSGFPGYTGNGGPAVDAMLSSPSGLAVDGAGNLLIADSMNNVIRQVNLAGTISTVAGTGSCTGRLVGNGSAATAAQLCSPQSLVTVSDGLLIADSNNNAIRKLSAGILFTVAGTGNWGWSGNGGAATDARLGAPAGIGVDAAGSLYIADTDNNTVRKVDSSTGIISVVAGSLEERCVRGESLCAPDGVSVGEDGTMYISDDGNYLVRQFHSVTLAMSVLAGNGTASGGYGGNGGQAGSALLNAVTDVAVDRDGNLFVADAGNSVVRRIDTDGVITTVTVTPPAGGPPIAPHKIAVGYDGTIYLQDPENIYRVPAGGGLAQVLEGSGGVAGGLATDRAGDLYAGVAGGVIRIDAAGAETIISLVEPTAIALGPNGEMYMGICGFLSRPSNSAPPTPKVGACPEFAVGDIMAIDADTDPISGFGESAGTGVAGLAVDTSGNVFYAQSGPSAVRQASQWPPSALTQFGDGFSGDGGPAGLARVHNPAGLAFTAAGDLLVADEGNDRLRVIFGAGNGRAWPLRGPRQPVAPPAAFPRAEFAGGGNPSEACPCPHAQATDYPVDTFDGNFWHTFTDLGLSGGRGMPLEVSRTYNSSMAARIGAFGHGWGSPLDMHLTLDVNGNIEVHQENGSVILFVPTVSGGYAPAVPRILASLTSGPNGFTLVRRHRTTFTFDPSGLLTSHSDRNGNTTTYTRSGDGALQSVTDAVGRTLHLIIDEGLVRTIYDDTDRMVTYTYDSQRNLIKVTDPTNAKWTFTYDDDHLLTTMTDPNQRNAAEPQPVTNIYDSSQRLISQTDFAGRTTTFDYTSQPGATLITDPRGIATLDGYTDGMLTSVTRAFGTPQAKTRTREYDLDTLQIITSTDPAGNITRATYDDNGNQTTSTDPNGHVSTATYNSLDEPLTVTDANLVTTTYTYDGAGNPLTKSTPVGDGRTATTVYSYGSEAHPSDLTAVTDPDGKTTTLGYDGDGNLDTVTAPNGDTSRAVYDEIGQRISWTLANATGPGDPNYTYHADYDANGRVTLQTDPLGHETATDYDPNGNPVEVIDPNSNSTEYVYDPAGQVTTVERADGSTLGSSYDANGNLISQTDAAGHATIHTYDTLNRLTSSTDPTNHTTQYSYNTAGRLATMTDPAGRSTSHTYDPAGQLTDIAYSDGTTPHVHYTYDPLGQRLTMTDGTGTTSYTRNKLGWLTASTNGAGGTTSSTYNLRGLVTDQTYPNGKHVHRSYNANGLLSAITDWTGTTSSFTYDADARISRIAYGDGSADDYTYDYADPVAGITARGPAGQQLLALSYTRDDNHQLTSETTNSLTPTTITYGHDELNRLINLGSPTVNGNYAYDTADNLSAIPGTLGTTTQHYDAANRLTSSTSPAGTTTTYSYNANGNRTQRTPTAPTLSTQYTYDQANRLLTVAAPPDQVTVPPVARITTTYQYNGDGLRTRTTTSPTTAPTAQFVYDLTGGLPRVITDGTNSYIYGPGGMPTAQINSTTNHATFLHTDQLGNVRLLTKAGLPIGNYTYDPYGNATHAGAATPLQYGSGYTDATRLVYLLARYYDPATAQFLTRDPVEAVTRSPYSYAGGDPLDNSDPSGLVTCGPNQYGGGCADGSPLPPGFDAYQQFQASLESTWARQDCEAAQIRAGYQETLDGLHALQAAQAAVDAADRAFQELVQKQARERYGPLQRLADVAGVIYQCGGGAAFAVSRAELAAVNPWVLAGAAATGCGVGLLLPQT